jgi:FAD/FMN-containing dehydrogenase
MHTHGLFLPPYPASLDYSTIGGAIGNNSAGEKSLKYGAMRKWVQKLEVVLANGEVIQTGRINKRELQKRKGLQTLEGEIYRLLDGLISDNADLIYDYDDSIKVSKDSSGYFLADVKHRDGSFDLTPLIVGSQGTLGIITEAIVKLSPDTPKTELLVAEFADIGAAHDAISMLLNLDPSAMEMVDRNMLKFVETYQPNRLKKLIDTQQLPAIVLLVEFDDNKDGNRKKKAKRAMKALAGATQVRRTDKYDEQQQLWAIRHSAAAVTTFGNDGRSALPIIEDGIVPPEMFEKYMKGVYALLKKHQVEFCVWGHAGDAHLHVQPLMDLGKMTDRQKILQIMTDYHALVIKLGGSIAGEHNDGRIRTPFLVSQHGEDLVKLYEQVKDIFDPHGTLNPGVKTGTDIKGLIPLFRREYALDQLADHLPMM